MSVKLISISKPVENDEVKSAEDLVAYCARVSNPDNQLNKKTAPRLLKYLIKHKHWSPFEMVSMTLEIKTSRAIAAQILRHRSFAFQEFSQRYSESLISRPIELRKQGETNRQVGDELIDPIIMDEWFAENFTTNRLGDPNDFSEQLAGGPTSLDSKTYEDYISRLDTIRS